MSLFVFQYFIFTEISFDMATDNNQSRLSFYENIKTSFTIANMLSSSFVSSIGDENIFVYAPQLTKKNHVNIEEFNEKMKNHLCWYINHPEDQYEDNNIFNITFPFKQNKIRYLDIDELKDYTADTFHQLLNNLSYLLMGYAKYALFFLPENINERIRIKKKIGTHIYVMMKDLSLEQGLITELKKLLLGSFDEQAWSRNSLTIPFAHKGLDSSKYILVEEYSFPSKRAELIKKITKHPFINHGFSREETIKQIQESAKKNTQCKFVPTDIERITDPKLIAIVNGFKGLVVHAHKRPLNVYRILGSIKSFTDDEKLQSQLFNEIGEQVIFYSDKGRAEYTYENLLKAETQGHHYYKNSLIKIVKEFNIDYFDSHEISMNTTTSLLPEISVNKSKLEYVSAEQIRELKTYEERIELLKKSIVNSTRQKCFLSRFLHENIEVLKDDEMRRELRTIFSGKSLSNALDVLYSNVYTDEVGFDKLFCGWKYDEKTKSDTYEQNISDFIDYILTNTFNGEAELFEYYLKRTSYILHNPGSLSKVCFIFKGLEGTGKNTFTDLIAELMTGYSNANAELSKISSRFNISSYLKTYVVCNEALDNKDNYQQTEYIKKVIERSTMDYEKKGIDTFTAENTMNLDITSNNSKPVVISPTDRRFAVVETSNMNSNNREYWSKWFDDIITRKTFYQDVFYYIFNEKYDDKFLSLPIPDNDARDRLMKLCLNPIHKIIIDNMELLITGASKQDIINKCYDNSLKYSEDVFWDKISKYFRKERNSRKKCDYWFIDDNISDIFYKFDKNSEEEEEIDEEVEKNDEEDCKNWIESNKKNHDEYTYILLADVNKMNIIRYKLIEMLENDNWTKKKSTWRDETRNKWIYVK